MPDFHSAYDGKFTSGRGKRRFDDDDPTTAKRVRGRRALPSIEQFDATDGLPEGDRWSTWDQTENLIPNDLYQQLRPPMDARIVHGVSVRS